VYLDGHTAVRRPATIRLSSTGLDATVEGGATFRWRYEEIHLPRRYQPGDPVRVEHGEGIPQALVVADAAFFASLRDVAGTGIGRIARGGRWSPLTVFGAVIGVIVVAFVMYRWGIPAIAHAVAARLPVSWDERIGSAVADRLAPSEKRCRGAAGQRALETLLGRLTSVQSSPYRFTIAVVDQSTVNAFAAPGGYVVVLRGLLDKARSPEELAGVLAHEVEHVLHRHNTRMLIERASTGLLVGILVGDVSGLIAFAAENASALSYSRQHEDEADVDGLRLMIAARLDPRGMIAFYETMMTEDRHMARGAARYLSTHPATEDRIARLRQLAAENPSGPTTPALSDADWTALRAICGPRQ
jgi:Zn-dependent protease with chaperone function